MTRILRSTCLFLVTIATPIFAAAADVYNPTSNQLSIPAVDVSGTTYTDVVITVGDVISVFGGTASGTTDSYNPARNQLSIPTVQVGDATYTNVVITVGQVISVGGSFKSIRTIYWRQTENEISLSNEWLTNLSGEGFTSYDFSGNGVKSFFFPSGADSRSYPRLASDPDFQVFQLSSGNKISKTASPLDQPYIAGHVNDDILTGKFLKDAEKTLIFIDHGREPQSIPFDQWEKSYLWRIDKSNGRWKSVEFAQDLGRQFWHSSSNPLDVNGDGLLDFSVAALSSAVNYLFLSSGSDFNKIRLADYMDMSETPNCGSSALIRLAGNKFGSICLPYTALNGSRGDTGYIFHLSASGKTVESVQKIKVRDTPETLGMDPGEGYNLIRVLDLNDDGLDDFFAHAEFSNGNNNKKTRLIAFLQDKDGQFHAAPSQMGIGPLYELGYGDKENFYANWTSATSMLIDINGDGKLDIAIPPQLISHNDISTKGIQAGLVKDNGRYNPFTIPASQIIFNSTPKPYSYRTIYPADLNNDGIIDFVLLGTFFDQPKSASNPYGQRLMMTLLISERQ